ncbi:putative BTB/POZ domain-containing protein [Cotonvirus japonicus]|uniref:BTB/POZ domain-containing protein n=1 Tax=Cotonvirus japonicus TaxID=2811091 RepID=A0ABM7NRH2_9VIRU|nr:putative BTB/POZ domain-containing protein [Cotonvirus japonicus]BCS82744.1 putative BTB/POZ domain-containing protein [Cotonvirus japonicus]
MNNNTIITINTLRGPLQTRYETISGCSKLVEMINDCTIDLKLSKNTVLKILNYLRGCVSIKELYNNANCAYTLGIIFDEEDFVYLNIGGIIVYLNKTILETNFEYFQAFFRNYSNLEPDYTSILIDRCPIILKNILEKINKNITVFTEIEEKELEYYCYKCPNYFIDNSVLKYSKDHLGLIKTILPNATFNIGNEPSKKLILYETNCMTEALKIHKFVFENSFNIVDFHLISPIDNKLLANFTIKKNDEILNINRYIDHYHINYIEEYKIIRLLLRQNNEKCTYEISLPMEINVNEIIYHDRLSNYSIKKYKKYASFLKEIHEPVNCVKFNLNESLGIMDILKISDDCIMENLMFRLSDSNIKYIELFSNDLIFGKIPILTPKSRSKLHRPDYLKFSEDLLLSKSLNCDIIVHFNVAFVGRIYLEYDLINIKHQISIN